MMKKVCQLVLIGLALIVASAGCGPVESPSAPIAPVKQTVGRIKDTWIKADDTKGVKLEDNLLRKNIYLIFDCSGSMVGRKIAAAKEAINQFGKSIPEDTGLGLAIFDGHGLSERLPLGVNNRKEFFAVVNAASADGGTPLSEAVKIGYESLKAQARRQLGYGEYHLVIVTDGEANMGYDHTDMVNLILRESPVVIHTIGFEIGPEHSLNQPGRTIYKDAQSPKDLEEGLQSVMAEADTY